MNVETRNFKANSIPFLDLIVTDLTNSGAYSISAAFNPDNGEGDISFKVDDHVDFRTKFNMTVSSDVLRVVEVDGSSDQGLMNKCCVNA